MKLSDAFNGLSENETPQFELIVQVININYKTMPDSLKKNTDITGYALFVEKVRIYQSTGKSLSEAIRQATQECLNGGVLLDFLHKFKNEVDAMFSLIYNEERAKEVAREEGGIKTLVIQITKKKLKMKTREQIIEELELDTNGIDILDNINDYIYLIG